MTITYSRNQSLTRERGMPSLIFAGVIEDLVDSTNKLSAQPVNSQDSNYTFLLTDALEIVRKTSSTTNQVYTIPSNVTTAFDIGTVLEVQNDGSVDMKVAIDTDTMTSEAGLGTGTRTIGPSGSGRFVKVAATKWKARGEQMT